MTILICKTCRWRDQSPDWKRLRWFAFWLPSFWRDYVKHGTCTHPDAEPYFYDAEYDNVTGDMGKKRPSPCVSERRAGNCGPAGKLWEQR